MVASLSQLTVSSSVLLPMGALDAHTAHCGDVLLLVAVVCVCRSNPSGRILNRFTKDMDNIDKYMLRAATDWWSFSIIALGAIVAILVILPWLLILEAVLLTGMVLLTMRFLTSSRQLRRLEGTTRSPVFQVRLCL